MSEFLSSHATEMIRKGSWEDGLAYLWDHINKGNELALQALAEISDENGLHAFSQQYWSTLAEASGQAASRARQGLVSNFLWIRDYESAKSIIALDPTLTFLSRMVSEQEEMYDLTKRSDFLEYAQANLNRERELLNLLEGSFTVSAQIELIQIRDVLGVLSGLISYPNTKWAGMQSISVGVGNFQFPKPLNQSLGTPSEAWWRAAQSTCVLIERISNQDPAAVSSELMRFVANHGHIALQKLFLDKGLDNLDDNDKGLINGVGWALSRLGEFSSCIYGGLLEID